jgi:hypothetical protein
MVITDPDEIPLPEEEPTEEPETPGEPVPEGPYYVKEVEKDLYQVRTETLVRGTVSNLIAAQRRCDDLNREEARMAKMTPEDRTAYLRAVREEAGVHL